MSTKKTPAPAAAAHTASQTASAASERIQLPKGFRPQDVPVLAVDHTLPKVPDAAQTIAAMRERFERQPVWVPEWVRESPLLGALERAPIQAAVLIPIVARSEPTVLLTRRSAQLKTHSGQIAFPGGRIDPQDADAVAAALREAQEEVALSAQWVEVIGQLPAYVTGTGFHVVPVVGVIAPDLPLRANPHEVDEIFEVPLRFVLDPANHRHHAYTLGQVQRKWLSMPYMAQGREYFIWGVTASILRNFYRFMQAPWH